MARRTRKRSNPWRILLLVILIGGAIYLNQIVIPQTPQLFVPTPTPTRSPESFVNEAEKSFADGKMIAAIEAYRQAVLVDPQNKSNYVAMARVQIFAGQYQQALESAERALVGNDNYSMAHALRGWALNFLKQYNEAEIAVTKAIELDPNNPQAHAYYAEILINRYYDENQVNPGDRQKAGDESRTALALAPKLLDVLRARAYVLYLTANYADSLETYQAAVNINKNIADLFLNMGYDYVGMADSNPDNTTNAIKMFLQAKALNPTNPVPDVELSRIFMQMGEYGKAAQYAENAVKIDPETPERYGNLGMMYYKAGDYVKAIQALTLLVHGGISPDGAVVKGASLDYGWMTMYYTYYGFALAKVVPNRCSEAVLIFQALLSVVPNDQTAVDNATIGLDLCKQAAGTPNPTPVVTPKP